MPAFASARVAARICATTCPAARIAWTSPAVLISTTGSTSLCGITIPVLLSRYGPTATEPSRACPRGTARPAPARGTRPAEHGRDRGPFRRSRGNAAQDRDRPDRHARLLHRGHPGRRPRPIPGGDRPGLRGTRGLRGTHRGPERLSFTSPIRPAPPSLIPVRLPE